MRKEVRVMRILLTGFDPFGGEKINPAFEAVKLVQDRIADSDIIKLEIPTVIGKCDKLVAQMVREKKPDVVLSIGQAGGRFDISVERVAVNIIDARIPDNEGNQPFDQQIRKDGENAYFATIPVKAIAERIKSKGLPASVSYTAGTYVCNYIMYCELYMAATEFPKLRCGFIHVPFSTSQAINKPTPVPTMSIENMTLAIEAAIETIIAS
jgi:pyroglutamyl-peptidase